MFRKRSTSKRGGNRRQTILSIAALTLLVSSLLAGIAGPAAGVAIGLTGQVTESDGAPVSGVQADLFVTVDGNRTDYLGSATSDAAGAFRFEAKAGCYAVVVIAPEGRSFKDSRWLESHICLKDDDSNPAITAVLDQVDSTHIGGTVRTATGEPVGEVAVDLFDRAPDGSRGQFLGYERTGADGTYRFSVASGCYVVTFIAPDGGSFNNSRWLQAPVCADKDKPATEVDATLDEGSGVPATIGGFVTDGSQNPVIGLEITYWEAGNDGRRSEFLGSIFTGEDGRFSLAIDAGCYWLVYIAPDGRAFNGSPYMEASFCVESGDVIRDLDAALDPDGPSPTTLRVLDRSGSEGAQGEQRQIPVVIRRSEPFDTEVTVDVTSVDGTATAGSDYEPLSTTVTLRPGIPQTTVVLTVFGDDIDEPDETVTIELSNPTGEEEFNTVPGTITIVNDEGPPGTGPLVDDQSFSVEEFSSPGFPIGFVVAREDQGRTIRFSIDDSSAVTIGEESGRLQVVDPTRLLPDTQITANVTATDDLGRSDTGLITIDVTRIDLLPNPNSATTSTGATLEVEITDPDDRVFLNTGTFDISGIAGVDGTAGPATVTYVVDVSDSTNEAGNDCNGDGAVDEGDNLNPGVDSSFGRILDCEIAGLLALNRSLAGFPVEVSLVMFAGDAAAVDVSPNPDVQLTTTPTADVDGNGTPDIEEVLTGIGIRRSTAFDGATVRRGTNFGVTLEAVNELEGLGVAGRSGFVFFLSDGEDVGSGTVLATQIEALAANGVRANSYSIGERSSGCGDSRLNSIAEGTGGVCVEVADPGALTGALATAPEGLESVVVTINGGSANEATVNALGQWSTRVRIFGPGRFVLRATATASDGTEVAAEILVLRVL